MSYPNLTDVGHSMAESPLHCEGQDAVFAAKERNVREMEGEDPNIRPQRDFKSGETQSEDSDWVVPSEDDPLGEGVGPGGQRLSPVPSVCSMKSDWSMNDPPEFTGGSKHTRVDLDRTDSLSSRSSSCKPSDDSTPVDEASSQHTTERRGVLCAVCPKGASKSCLTCTASFCEVHVKQHYTAPALQRHMLVDATEDLEQRLCQRHNRDRELYCRTDQTAICLSCLIIEHIGHDIISHEEHQHLQKKESEMENKTAGPPPGPIEFTSVKPDSVCVSWGPPEGLAGPHRFRVTWSGEGSQEHLEVQDLKLDVQELTPGEEYLFTVATLSDDGRQSSSVSATVRTDIPPPGCLAVAVVLTSVSVTWSKPEGVIKPSYILTLHRDGGCLNTVSTRSLQHRYELEMEAEYTISVSTVLKGGQSKPISKTITTNIPPPGCLTVAVDLTSVSVTWSKPEGVVQVSYLLTLHRDGGCLNTVSTRSLQHRYEMEMEREYTISVSTVLKGVKSKPISKTIRTSYPVPEKLTVISMTPTSADLSWSLHQGMEQFPHSFLISYHSEETELQTTSTQSCSTTLTGLTPDTNYTVTVCCELRDGGRSQAATLVIKTGIYVPEGLSVDALNEESDAWSADLSWSPGHGTDQIPHSFEISYHSEGNEPKTISTESCSTTLKGLHSDTQYTVSICTVLRGRRKSKSVSTTFHTSERRIVLLGKSGDGKSSTGSTLLGKEVFKVSVSQYSERAKKETHSSIINGRKYTVIDTPGFFDNTGSEEGLPPEIDAFYFDSSPGPHAFLIVMRVGRFTKQEEEVIMKIKELFAEDTYKHAVVLFTHGRDLKGQTIEQFVEENRSNQGTEQRKSTLKELVDKCNGRYHVIDNEHWKGDGNNRIQLAKLFDTIEEMVEENEGCYINDILLLVEQAIQREIRNIRKHERNLTDRDIRAKAKSRVAQKFKLNKCVATFTVLLYAFFCLIPAGISSYIDQAAASAGNSIVAVIKVFQLLTVASLITGVV